MFKQSKGRAFDGASPPEAAKHPPHQGRLSSAELPRKRDQHSAHQPGRKARSRARGGLGIRQEGTKLFYNRHHFFGMRGHSKLRDRDPAWTSRNSHSIS